MFDRLRFEISFKDAIQLEEKLSFCKSNGINNINIPCKGNIKKEFLNSTFDYINKNYQELSVVYHYSLFHQYSRNKKNSYKELLNFINKCNSNNNYEVLLVSGSTKKKHFDAISVLTFLKNEKNLKMKFGIAYNPYLKKYFDVYSERENYEKKISSSLVNSIWLQFGTDIKLLEKEIYHLKQKNKFKKINLFGSLFIPSKQFISRFKFRPWRGVYISKKYLSSLDDFYSFTKELLSFYIKNDITPLIETDFSSNEKLSLINDLFKN